MDLGERLSKLLIQIVSACIRPASASAFAISEDHAAPPRPGEVAFTRLMTSSSVSQESTGTIGPNLRQWYLSLLRSIDLPNGSWVTIFE